MDYEPILLAEKIINDLEEDMTFYDTFYDFDDCCIHVSGIVSQDFEYTPQTYDTPPWMDLTSRTADLYIKVYNEHGEYNMDINDIYQIEKMIER